MPSLSIIVVLSDDIPSLETTLVSVLENRPEDCEVLVVHRGVYDDPYDLSDEINFLEVPRTAGHIECLTAGFDASCGSLVHILASGATVERDWADRAINHFQDPQCAAVVPLVLDAKDDSRIVSLGVAYWAIGMRHICLAGKPSSESDGPLRGTLGPTLIAAFYRRSALKAIGGLCRLVGHQWADVDVGLSFRASGHRITIERQSRIRYAPTRKPACGEFQRGRFAERTFWRHVPTAGWSRSLLLHPLLWGWEFFTNLPRSSAVSGLLGRTVGLASIRDAWCHRRQLRQAWEEVAEARAAPHKLTIFVVDNFKRHDRQSVSETSAQRKRAG